MPPCAMPYVRLVLAVILAIVLQASCTGVRPSHAATRIADTDRVLDESACWGQKVARAARWYLHNKQTRGRRDCSGLIEAVLGRAGVNVRGSSRDFWLAAARNGRLVADPQPGDLAFFDGTWDANHNGRFDDDLTHIAVVVEVDCEGTVTMVHRAGRGPVGRLKMNLHDPTDRERNDFLRARGYGRKGDPKLSGELFRIFARPPST